MEKIQGMAAAMLDFAAEYAAKHEIDNHETMSALAHTYVIYGFIVKKDDADQQVLKAAMIECVTASVDHMIEVSADAEKA